jgi:hypothetical protein
LSDPIALVGLGEECDLRLIDDRVAEMACVLVPTDNVLLVRDLGTGRTRVNGVRVVRAALWNNDILDVAGVRFRVRFEEKPTG